MRRFDATLTPLLGRLMLAAIFVWGGLGKAMQPGGTIGYIGHAGLPMPQAAYAVAVIVELAGGLLLAVGLLTRPVAVLLAVWCLVTAAIFHADFAQLEMLINAYKNLAIAGGLLYVAASGAGLWSLDAMRGRRLHALA
jgi:putative oxidoreductase